MQLAGRVKVSPALFKNAYQSVLVPQNLPFPEKFLVVSLHSGIILFTKKTPSYMFDSVLNMSLSQ